MANLLYNLYVFDHGVPNSAHIFLLIETLYRENVSFRDRDLKRQIPCHTASKNLDAQLLRNDTSFLSNLLC